ncbi:hypothetical protein [Mycobacterium heidelbergense]|uniref:hypothetical protein n=1 Tax=Mycobacterium heidelbergense TaxID=53376 RepID=UPI001E2F1252|nr:hypothetical protein [Mycobacterium heidelbergense]
MSESMVVAQAWVAVDDGTGLCWERNVTTLAAFGFSDDDGAGGLRACGDSARSSLVRIPVPPVVVARFRPRWLWRWLPAQALSINHGSFVGQAFHDFGVDLGWGGVEEGVVVDSLFVG